MHTSFQKAGGKLEDNNMILLILVCLIKIEQYLITTNILLNQAGFFPSAKMITYPSSQSQRQLTLVPKGKHPRYALAHRRHELFNDPVPSHVPLLQHLPHGRRHQPHRRGQELQRGEGKADICGGGGGWEKEKNIWKRQSMPKKVTAFVESPRETGDTFVQVCCAKNPG